MHRPGLVGRILLACTIGVLAVVIWPSVGVSEAAKPLADCAGNRKPSTMVARALVIFVRAPLRTAEPVMLDEFERLPNSALGLVSPTLGRYSPTQMLLDISQGSRVASGLYKPALAPPLALVKNTSNGHRWTARIRDWGFVESRADKAPGELEPGTLSSAIHHSGGSAAYVGSDGDSHLPALVAADRCGVIDQIAIGPRAGLVTRAAVARRRHALTIVDAGAGMPALVATRQLLGLPGVDWALVLQQPPDPARTRLLSIALHGRGNDRKSLRSRSTRRDGLIATTDLTATLLDHLGVPRPSNVEGQVITVDGDATAKDLDRLNARLALVGTRRVPFMREYLGLLLGGLLLLWLLARAIGRTAARSVLRRGGRLIALTMMFMPLMLLATAALFPSRNLEVAIAAVGGLLLAAGTDRLLPWPRGPLLPGLAVPLAYAADFAFNGSQLTGQSLLGPNPHYGARFYGAGNELESAVVLIGLFGIAVLLTIVARGHLARGFALAGVFFAAVLGAGPLGADVGGVIMVAAGFGAAAVVAAGPRRISVTLAVIAAASLIGLAGLALVDQLAGGDSHFARSVLQADSPGDLVDVATRRLKASAAGARQGITLWLMMLAAFALLAGWVRRRKVMEPTYRLGEVGNAESSDAGLPYRAAFAGALSATLIGALANDSGPAILIISTVLLGVAVAYLHAGPEKLVAEP